MIKNFKHKIKKNYEIFSLICLILFTATFTSYFNHKKNIEKEIYNNFIQNIYLKKTLNQIINNLEPKYKKVKHKIKKGETFDKILEGYSVNKEEVIKIKNSLQKKVDLNKLNTQQIVKFSLDKTTNKITEFTYQISNTQKIFLKRNIINDSFDKEILTIKLLKEIVYEENVILQSLYKAATDEKIPANIIIEFARIYGFQVDFQRDVRKQDKFQIMYEIFLNEKKEIVETGEILFANLKLSGQDNSLYYFDKSGSEGHYDKNGKSVKKALMKTPINGARLSSPFGMRKHPIDGFNKMHRGTDFAAPMGTPIMASGDGVVKKAGWCGGGGNCVKIKHNSTYQTVYAHMSKFARGIKAGVRVKQGQTIGYVGSTGKSTGPHLHYEVIINGKKVNSQKLKLPSGKILKGNERKIFETKKIKLDVLKSEKILGIN
ncbi:M23 family metallopeptidase [Candidatus Pelagibacter sp.]|nr:M23 family metallopeptidase [Candidatus Pelagibacter sp.]